MASGVYNEGATQLQSGGSISWSGDTIKAMLLGLSTPYTFEPDEAVLTTAALSELNVSGYAPGFAGAGRATLGSKTLTKDNGTNRTIYDAADPAAWTLAAGDSVTAAIIYKHLTNDAASIPIFYVDFVDVLTNGGTFTLQFHANGINYLQNG
jgi:hypothetical protein